MSEKYVNKKYNILKILNTKFSKDQTKVLKEKIKNELPVSNRSLINWLYLTHKDTTEISYKNLKKIASILGEDIDNLLNF